MDPLHLECPSQATAADLRAHKLSIGAYHPSGLPVPASELTTTVTSLSGNHEKYGAEWASTQDGFVVLTAHPQRPGGVLLALGDAHYTSSEHIRITVTHDGNDAAQSCDLVISAAELSAAQRSKAAATAPALGIVSVNSAASGATIGLVGTPQCGLHSDLPLGVNVLGLEIDNSQHLGALVGNLCLILAASGLLHVLSRAADASGSTFLSGFAHYAGFGGLPSVWLYVFILLYQGTVFVTQYLIIYPSNLGQFLSGLFGLIFCVAVPFWVVYRVWRGVPKSAVYAGTEVGTIGRILLGPGEWVAVSRGDLWLRNHMSPVRPYRQASAWFCAFFFLMMFAAGALTVPDTTDFVQCGHLRMGLAVLFLSMAIFVGSLRPYCRPRDNALYTLVYLATTAAMVFQGLAYYSEDLNDSRFETAVTVLTVAMVAILIKAAVDAVSDIYVIVSSRRRITQDTLWAKDDQRTGASREVDEKGYLSVFGELEVDSINSTTRSSLQGLSPRTADLAQSSAALNRLSVRTGGADSGLEFSRVVDAGNAGDSYYTPAVPLQELGSAVHLPLSGVSGSGSGVPPSDPPGSNSSISIADGWGAGGGGGVSFPQQNLAASLPARNTRSVALGMGAGRAGVSPGGPRARTFRGMSAVGNGLASPQGGSEDYAQDV